MKPIEKMLLIRIDKEKIKQFKTICAEDGVSMRQVLSDFINVYLEARKGKKK